MAVARNLGSGTPLPYGALDRPHLVKHLLERARRVGVDHVTPVATMSRCATRDVQIRGRRIREGQYVTMVHGSANRDEDVFGPNCDRLAITRNPNPHLIFGCGEHSCLGAQLARLEATLVPGVKNMPVRLATTTVSA